MTAVRDFRTSFFNPRHGPVGIVGWPGMVLFEYLAPIIEMAGYLIVPVAMLIGAVAWENALLMLAVAFLAGAFTSLIALFLDERYGYFNKPLAALRLVLMVFVENFGLRQQTVWWRIRALIGGKSTQSWGDMQRRGVHNLRKAS
jgi:hypothetical protein